jgi:cytosine/adenosine deaminase-related metal-dependent hydrolase
VLKLCNILEQSGRKEWQQVGNGADMGPTVAQVFNLGTTGPVTGGRSSGRMAGEVGQIKTGAKADLVIFGMTSPSMLAAADRVLESQERFKDKTMGTDWKAAEELSSTLFTLVVTL